MRIAGFQPLSLLDYPGVISSIIFTQGCLFRCSYCHNPELIPMQTDVLLDEEEILKKIEKQKNMVSGICITGGEPTVQPDLSAFIRRLKDMGMLVKLDTNGIHADKVEELLRDKLVDYIAMDLKHVWDRYGDVTQRKETNITALCQRTFGLIQSSGLPHEFRTTTCASLHDEEELHAMAAYMKPVDRYVLQEIRYKKMLDPTLEQRPSLDLKGIVERMRAEHPGVEFAVRMA